MDQSDPLALRHGALIAQVWAQIAIARHSVRQGLPQDRAKFWRRRMRHLKWQVLKARKLELSRPDAARAGIDNWFLPVTHTLTRAEAYFSACLTQPTAQRVEKVVALH